MPLSRSIPLSLTLIAPVPVLTAAEGDPPPPAPTVEQRLDDLDQEIRILKRQRELAEEEHATATKKASVSTAGDRGFSLATADKAYSLKLGVIAHLDGVFFPDDEDIELVDQFQVRRARLQASGSIAGWVDYRLLADFAASTVLQDAYLDGRVVGDAVRVRVGQTKAPVGLERLRSTTALPFLEFGYPTNLVPNREVTLQTSGSVVKAAEWTIGIANGATGGGSATGDTTDAKEFQGRLWLTPFSSGETILAGLGFGVGATWSDSEDEALDERYRSVGRQDIYRYQANIVSDGAQTRLAPQLYWSAGPGSLLAEYTISNRDVRQGAVSRSAEQTAWQVQIGWVLTGEDAGWRGVVPKQPFKPGSGAWGAWEIAARATAIDLDTGLIDAGFIRAGAVESATTFGVGFTWYLDRNLKWQLDVESTDFTGGAASGADRERELLVGTRFQLVL